MSTTQARVVVTITARSVWWKRARLASFLFFLIKGLLWLAAPLILYAFS